MIYHEEHTSPQSVAYSLHLRHTHSCTTTHSLTAVTHLFHHFTIYFVNYFRVQRYGDFGNTTIARCWYFGLHRYGTADTTNMGEKRGLYASERVWVYNKV